MSEYCTLLHYDTLNDVEFNIYKEKLNSNITPNFNPDCIQQHINEFIMDLTNNIPVYDNITNICNKILDNLLKIPYADNCKWPSYRYYGYSVNTTLFLNDDKILIRKPKADKHKYNCIGYDRKEINLNIFKDSDTTINFMFKDFHKNLLKNFIINFIIHNTVKMHRLTIIPYIESYLEFNIEFNNVENIPFNNLIKLLSFTSATTYYNNNYTCTLNDCYLATLNNIILILKNNYESDLDNLKTLCKNQINTSNFDERLAYVALFYKKFLDINLSSIFIYLALIYHTINLKTFEAYGQSIRNKLKIPEDKEITLNLNNTNIKNVDKSINTINTNVCFNDLIKSIKTYCNNDDKYIDINFCKTYNSNTYYMTLKEIQTVFCDVFTDASYGRTIANDKLKSKFLNQCCFVEINEKYYCTNENMDGLNITAISDDYIYQDKLYEAVHILGSSEPGHTNNIITIKWLLNYFKKLYKFEFECLDMNDTAFDDYDYENDEYIELTKQYITEMIQNKKYNDSILVFGCTPQLLVAHYKSASTYFQLDKDNNLNVTLHTYDDFANNNVPYQVGFVHIPHDFEFHLKYSGSISSILNKVNELLYDNNIKMEIKTWYIIYNKNCIDENNYMYNCNKEYDNILNIHKDIKTVNPFIKAKIDENMCLDDIRKTLKISLDDVKMKTPRDINYDEVEIRKIDKFLGSDSNCERWIWLWLIIIVLIIIVVIVIIKYKNINKFKYIFK